ncbi:MAG TPA: hypothetical protein VHX42_05210 [Candidatus Babeliales bacterium]|nr:hypothetical protein [Candidatus Babeliales bacterium]
MKLLGISLMVFATGSLMSMQEDNKKQHFIINYSTTTYLGPFDKNRENTKLPFSKNATRVIYQGCDDAKKYGKGQVLFKFNEKQCLAKISLMKIESDNRDHQGFLLKIKPWDKVKVFEENQ